MIGRERSAESIAEGFLRRHVRPKAKELGVDLIVEENKKYVSLDLGIKALGYFSPGYGFVRPRLAFSKLGSCQEWLSTLVHESCHMDQWAEACPAWASCQVETPSGLEDAVVVIDDWLAGERYSRKTIRAAIDRVIQLELDCERRSVQKIKDYKLPIDVDAYVREANCVLYFYAFLFESRKWYPSSRTPRKIKSIVSRMPSTFDVDHWEIDWIRDRFAKLI